jgi:hypothetical protein
MQQEASVIKPKKWVKYTEALNAAGVVTGTGRGFWGGIAQDGTIVVTSWTTDNDNGRRLIHKPFTNHGGLRRAWESGDIAIGAQVRVILTDAGRSEFTGNKKKAVVAASVEPGYYKILGFGEFDGHPTASIEPVIPPFAFIRFRSEQGFPRRDGEPLQFMEKEPALECVSQEFRDARARGETITYNHEHDYWWFAPEGMTEQRRIRLTGPLGDAIIRLNDFHNIPMEAN